MYIYIYMMMMMMMMMMFQESVGWMFRILVILKTWKMKTRNQKRLGLAGHESSDNKVSFSLSRYRIFRILGVVFRRITCLILLRMSVYLVLWRQLLVW